MYNNPSNKDLLGAALTAGLGAGIVTSFAVAQGQHPLIGLAITVMAALCGMILRHFELV